LLLLASLAARASSLEVGGWVWRPLLTEVGPAAPGSPSTSATSEGVEEGGERGWSPAWRSPGAGGEGPTRTQSSSAGLCDRGRGGVLEVSSEPVLLTDSQSPQSIVDREENMTFFVQRLRLATLFPAFKLKRIFDLVVSSSPDNWRWW